MTSTSEIVGPLYYMGQEYHLHITGPARVNIVVDDEVRASTYARYTHLIGDVIDSGMLDIVFEDES
jgi:outer membrane scaffolding protein for murein synthesis (MipA/OmpV family)